MNPILSINNLSKKYDNGFNALNNINLDIMKGEIFALLGPNGAGKTTLINIICGIVNPTGGTVLVDGNNIISSYRSARSIIGLVPQELATDAFEKVIATVSFSRGLVGKPQSSSYVENILKDLSLWEKRQSKINTLSGGMKRRVMIAKALSHEPKVLFLDEPTAGVDVELREGLWDLVRLLKDTGVTIILTTHYIKEAEVMADRIGVISNGSLVVVEEKNKLMRKLGKKQLVLQLQYPLNKIPENLSSYNLELSDNTCELIYTYDTGNDRTGITRLLQDIRGSGINFNDLYTIESSLEEIFVNLVKETR